MTKTIEVPYHSPIHWRGECSYCGASIQSAVHNVVDPMCRCQHRSGLHEAHSGNCFFPECPCNEWRLLEIEKRREVFYDEAMKNERLKELRSRGRVVREFHYGGKLRKPKSNRWELLWEEEKLDVG